jgi:hypothetical protein
MLSEAPPGCFHGSCDRCGTAQRFEASDAAAARQTLTTAGWMEAAVKARPRERWLWWCPTCKPKAPTSMGRSTV